MLTTDDRPAWLTTTAWWRVTRMATSAGTLAVTDAGAGPAVVLAHVGAWGFLWRGVVRALAPSHRCIVVDPPGTGLSALCGDRVALAQAATGLRDVLDHLDLRAVTLVVHDLGGPPGSPRLPIAPTASARSPRALVGPLADLPVLTVFGEHNDPLGFQPQWRARFPHAREEVVPGSLHFPMCDAPDLVARLLGELALDARAAGPPSAQAGAPPVVEPPQQEPGRDR